jgi:CBS domain-containing protein
MRVSDILKVKGNAVMSVRLTETIQAIAKRFQQDRVGALVVSSDGASLDGIITERDLVLGLAMHGAELGALPVSTLATATVVTCAPEDSVAQVANIMTNRRLRHLPVREGRQLVGVVSIGDVLKHRLVEVQLRMYFATLRSRVDKLRCANLADLSHDGVPSCFISRVRHTDVFCRRVRALRAEKLALMRSS